MNSNRIRNSVAPISGADAVVGVDRLQRALERLAQLRAARGDRLLHAR